MKVFSTIVALIIFTILFVNGDNPDSDWMKYIKDDTSLNDINIPGTHDSGTTTVDVSTFSRTQDLYIKGQLEHGIRYLDIRMTLKNNDDDIIITHNGARCFIYDSQHREILLTLDKVFEIVINFLKNHPTEVIIMHLKEEASKGIDTQTFKNKISAYTKANSNFFYNSTQIPTLGQAGDPNSARGKIFIATRYIDAEHAYLEVADMGDCRNYFKDRINRVECYPILKDDKYFVQDNYNLDATHKWNIVKETLSNNTLYYKDINKQEILLNKSQEKLSSCYTINFLNTARIDLSSIEHIVEDFICDSSITASAYYVNKELASYINNDGGRIIKNWVIMDFPTSDAIRAVYQSNAGVPGDKEKISGIGMAYANARYYLSKIFPWILRRDGNNNHLKACIQRKIYIDNQGKQHDEVKTDYKCISNVFNKWSIERNGEFFHIISSYDGKCLSLSNNILGVSKCNDNSKSQDFNSSDGNICARVGNYCFDGDIELLPVILEPKEYDSLTCSSRFIKSGYSCCRNQNARVEKVDDIGNWAKENGKWCGIGYERCTFELAGYHCCSSVNPEVVDTDELGQWGFEDGEKCGIGEIKKPNGPYRIRNVKTNKCLVTKANDKNKIYVGDCSEYNDNNKYTQWYWNNTQIVSAQYTGKYMYIMNYKNAVLGSDSDVLGQDDVYSHFEYNNDGTFCIKYDGQQYCLRQTNENDKEINFELLSNSEREMFQWRIENLDRSDYNIITSINWYPYNPDRNNDPPKISPPSDSDCPVDDYPCCSPEITEVIYTDDKGDWGTENGDWCLIFNSS